MSDLTINRSTPVVDFLSADFEALRTDLISFMRAEHSDKFTDFTDDQLGVMLLDLVSYAGDLVDYHVNSTMRELFASTLRRKQNLRSILAPFGLDINPATAANVVLRLPLDPLGTYPFDITIADTSMSNGDAADPVYYQPLTAVTVNAYPGVGYVDVTFTEGEYYENVLVGVGNGMPNQTYQFPQKGLISDTLSLTVGGVTWTRVASLVKSRSTDNHYRVLFLDDGSAFVQFGDGQAGACPSQEVRATLRIGGGKRGNISAGITSVVAAHSNITGCIQLTKATDGAEEQSLREARRKLPAALSTGDRIVNEDDAAAMAVQFAGVGKAFAVFLTGTRIMRTYIAPTNGGVPSLTLLTNVRNFLSSKKMAGRVHQTASVNYRDLRLTLLLHVNPGYVAETTRGTVLQTLLNGDGTGLLDFRQLDFGGVDRSTKELLIGQTRLQDHFASLKKYGLERAEIKRLDVLPLPRANEGNTGNGGIVDLKLTGNQRRRQYVITAESATTYRVFERIVGTVTGLTDAILRDDAALFSEEGVTDFSNYNLVPDTDRGVRYTVASVTDQEVTITGDQSLFSVSYTGASYALEPVLPPVLNIGSTFSSLDGSVSFTLNNGVTPFVNGDTIVLEVYPAVGDVRLRMDEFPRLLVESLIARTTGGARL